MIKQSPIILVISAYCETHQRILTFLQNLSDEQLRWRPTAECHSIAFHAWHVARWADYFRVSIPGMTPELNAQLGTYTQIWDSEALAARWGFDSAQLGYAATGMNMSDAVAMRLHFPAKPQFLRYIETVFALAQQTVSAIDDQQFLSIEQSQPMTKDIWAEGTVGGAVMAHVTHVNRHLGMMECILGLQGHPGTATR